MRKRSKLKRKTSKKMFRKGAQKVNRKNISPRPVRGGNRM